MFRNQQSLTLNSVYQSLHQFTNAFTQRPVVIRHNAARASTDGQTISLPAINPRDMASVSVAFGHVIHEISHIRYSQFGALDDCASFVQLVNVLEDIRVDRLMAKELPGAYFARKELIESLLAIDKLPRLKDNDSAVRILCLTLYWVLTEEVHDYGIKGLPTEEIKTAFCANFGQELFDKILPFGLKAAYADSTFDVANYSKEILRLFFNKVYPDAPEIPKERPLSVSPASTMKQSLEARESDSFINSVFSNCAGTDLGKTSEEVLTLRSSGAESEDGPVNLWPVVKEDMKVVPLGDFLSRSQNLFSGYANKIRRQLQAKTLRCSLLGRSGRNLACSELSRVSVGDSRVFLKEESFITESAAFTVLLDRSGSMEQEMMNKAKQMAYAVSELFSSLNGCACSCYAFPGITRRTLLEVKGFNDSCRNTVARFASVRAFGFTPVVEALNTAAMQLSMRPEARKIIFVITDGLCSEIKKVRKTVDSLESQGFEVLCLNIGNDIERIFRYQETILDSKDLAPAVYKLLAAYFRGEVM